MYLGLHPAIRVLLAQCPRGLGWNEVRYFWHTRHERMGHKKAQMTRNLIVHGVQDRTYPKIRSRDWSGQLRGSVFLREGKKYFRPPSRLSYYYNYYWIFFFFNINSLLYCAAAVWGFASTTSLHLDLFLWWRPGSGLVLRTAEVR